MNTIKMFGVLVLALAGLAGVIPVTAKADGDILSTEKSNTRLLSDGVEARGTIIGTPDRGSYQEGDTAKVSFSLSNTFTEGVAPGYIFLVPLDEATSNSVEITSQDTVNHTTSVLVYPGFATVNSQASIRLRDGYYGCKLSFGVEVRDANDNTQDNVIASWVGMPFFIGAENVAPSVTFIAMNETPVKTNGGSFMTAVPAGVQKTFSIGIKDPALDIDFADGDKAYTEIRFMENGTLTTVYCIKGVPMGKKMGYTFMTPGPAQITAKVRDKDMTDMDFEEAPEFTVNVTVGEEPAITLVPYLGSNVFGETDTGVVNGRIDVELSEPPSGLGIDESITVVLEVKRNGSNDGMLPVLDKQEIPFRNGQTKGSFHLSELDGTPQSELKGFRIRSYIKETTECAIDPTKTWRLYYRPVEDFDFFVVNENPQIGPGVVAATNEMSASLNVPVTIMWNVKDAISDQENMKVTWLFDGHSQTVMQPATGTYSKEILFTSAGSKVVTLMVEDKDGGWDTRSWHYKVEAPMTLEITPCRPGLGTLSEFSQKYTGAMGIGAGRVWTTDANYPTSVSNFTQLWMFDPINDLRPRIYAYGYKVDDIDHGDLGPAGSRDYALDAAGTWYSQMIRYNSYYLYRNADSKDSFFYCWLLYDHDDGNSTHLNGVIQPQIGEAMGENFVAMPEYDKEATSYLKTRVEGIFSIEHLKEDNVGDINQDGIPDVFAADTTWRGGLLFKFAGFELEKGGDLEGVGSHNGDGDYLPVMAPDGGAHVVTKPKWMSAGGAFTAYHEIRGFGDGLNFRQDDDCLNRNVRGKWISDPVFTPAESNAVARVNGLTLPDPEAEDYMAQVAAWKEGLNAADSWIPENRTDPTVEDTDGDGFSDGYEYYLWYGAMVGEMDAEGNVQRLSGSRLTPDGTAMEEEITPEEVAEAFNPTVVASPTPAERDTDNDGLTDMEEYLLGTSPINWDTDGDGLSDLDYVNRLDPDTDQVGGYTWTYVVEYGEACILGFSEDEASPYHSEILNIPFELGGFRVKALTSVSSPSSSSIASVTVPSSVTSIGEHAFDNWRGLTSVTIPPSVTSIGDYAFDGCTALKTIYVSPGDMRRVASLYAFGSSVEFVETEMPTVYSIAYVLGGGAHGVSHPTNAIYGTAFYVSAPTRSGYTFSGWTVTSGLDTSTAKWGTSFSPLTAIGSYSTKCMNGTTGNVYFKDLTPTANGNVTLRANWIPLSGFTYSIVSGSAVITEYTGSSSTVVIPSTIDGYAVTALADYAFCQSEITSITLPDSLTKIGEFSLAGCRNLMTIHLPANVAQITCRKCSPFGGNTNQATFTVAPENPYFTAVDGVLFTKDMKELISFPAGKNVEKYDIPSSVTNIWSCAFDGCKYLAEVKIPSSVTNIGVEAFLDCSGLMSFVVDADNPAYCSLNGLLCSKDGKAVLFGVNGDVTIPSGVTSIRDLAFYGCSGLTSVAIPSSVGGIGDYAFYYCGNLMSFVVDVDNPAYSSLNGLLCSKDGGTVLRGVNGDVTIPSGVTSIDDVAFYGCSGLTSVTIPSSVEEIGFEAFYGCSGLTSVTIPSSVTSIRNEAFLDCGELTSFVVDEDNPVYRSLNGLLCSKDGKTVILGVNGDVTIPPSVTNIDDYAFFGYSGLTSVAIPSSVTGIGDYAFYGCSGLTSVTIPLGVLNIGNHAFSGCSGLVSFAVDVDNPAYCSLDGLLCSKDGQKVVSGVNGDVTIPSGVTSIGDGAFYACSGLMSVTVPSSVTNIGECPFSFCSGLTSFAVDVDNPAYCSLNGLLCSRDGKTVISGVNGDVTIPSGVTSIGDYAFYGCSGLTSVAIPLGVTNIGNYAFYGCSGLAPVTIPSSVMNIGDYAFGNCSGLTSVTIPANVTNIGDAAFWACRGVTSFIVDEDNPVYCSLNGLLCSKDGKTVILGVNGDVTIPSNVTNIGERAFYGCCWLTSVTIPSSVANIGDYAFWDCGWLTSVTIPPSVTSINDQVFGYCSGLTSVTIPSSVTTMGYYVFEECTSLALVYFDGNAPTCVRNTFGYMSSGAKAYVKRDSMGWNVTIPGTWNGLAIDYYPTYAVVFNANGGSAVPAQTVELGASATRPADPTKDGHAFNGWFVDAGCTAAYDFNAPVTADITLYAKWVVTPDPVDPTDPTDPSDPTGPTDPTDPDPVGPTVSAPVLYTNPAATPFEGNANYNGWVRDVDGKLAGTLVIKSAKSAKPEKGGQSKVTVQYTPFGGKKQTIKLNKADYPVAGGNPTVNIPGVGLVTFGGTSFAGAGVQMGKDLAKSKDKAEKAVANARLARMNGTWTFALGTTQGYAALSVTVKKGKGKLTGTLPDGTKLSVSSVGILGDTTLAIPFVYAKKGSFGFVFWMNDNGTVAMSDVTEMTLASSAKLAVTELVGPSANHRLADGANRVFDTGRFVQTFTVSGKKWVFPKHVAKPTAEKPDLNPHSVKLTYTEKTGLVKGTFVWWWSSGKGAKRTVNGVVVDGVMYGSWFLKGWSPEGPVMAK